MGTPEDHGHEAQGAKGGKGVRQGVWTVPAGEQGGGGEEPSRVGGRPRG